MKKETQWEKLLKLLRIKPLSTMEIVREYIPAPQKVIETLRKKGYDIKTEPVEGQKYSVYVLYEHTDQLGLFNNAT